jgi:predicted enzyme related to lactoylglutathione lyase
MKIFSPSSLVLFLLQPVHNHYHLFVEELTDVTELQRLIKDQGVAIVTEADEISTGPPSFMIVDPDGNPILFDQHR